MSTKATLWWSKSGHLYRDYADPFHGPHAYLEIRDGLVKSLELYQTPHGLSVTLRLPPELLPILRADLRRSAARRSKPSSPAEFERGLKRLQSLIAGSDSHPIPRKPSRVRPGAGSKG